MHVPGSGKSLLQAKADGADVRMVYSPLEALRLAHENPGREVVFFGPGFETTMPGTAMTVLQVRGGRVRDTHITMARGGGGEAMCDLIEDVFLGAFHNPVPDAMEDQARLPRQQLAAISVPLAFTTDSYVVDPLFFPGGDVGTLAVAGTVNDLAMGGARPQCLSCAMVLEEGLPVQTLRRVVDSMQRVAQQAGVLIVTGDNSVVERGAADKLFINTAGIGVVARGIELTVGNARPGDVVIVNGFPGDHGTAMLVARKQLDLQADVRSDCQPPTACLPALRWPSRCPLAPRRRSSARMRARFAGVRPADDDQAMLLLIAR